jgi:hypothetical protein
MGILDNIEDSLRYADDCIELIEYCKHLNYLFSQNSIKAYNKAVKLLVEKYAPWLQPFNEYEDYLDAQTRIYGIYKRVSFNNSIPAILAYTPPVGRRAAILDVFDTCEEKPYYHLAFQTAGEIYEYRQHLMDIYPNTVIFKINDTDKFNILIKQITKTYSWY